MKRNKKRFPILILASVILPGIIISILGIYHVSGQKISRELNLRENFKKELNVLRENIEAGSLKLTDKVFRDIQGDVINPDDPGSILKTVKKVVMNHTIVKYPFLTGPENKFIFPLTRKAEVKKRMSTDLAAISPRIKNIYLRGNNIEFRERQFANAIKTYLLCLELKPSKRVLPYILNSIARNYFKLGKFFQSSYYYRKILTEYSFTVKANYSLYLTTLRQAALSNKYLDKSRDSLKLYLALYENIIRFESTSGSGEFELYKNEALDFISRYKSDLISGIAGERTTDTVRELQNLSKLDIELSWRYVDMDTGDSGRIQPGSAEQQASILKLQELYTPSDEKSKFYQSLRQYLKNRESSGETDTGIFFITLPPGREKEICFKPVNISSTEKTDLFFGFMIPEEVLKNSVQNEMSENLFTSKGLKLFITKSNKDEFINTGSSHPYPLMVVPFRKILHGNSLYIYSGKKDFFSSRAREEMRVSYILIFALVITLFLGTVLFYKYFSRETEILRSKSEFVDRVSHTLKTPLTRLKLMAENISSGWINNETKKTEFIENIIRETGRMDETIENMLDFSNIEEGKKQYNFESVKLQVFAEKILAQNRDELKSSGFKVVEDIDQDLPSLPLDREAFKLILSNLIQNSIKYSAGEKYISVKIYKNGPYSALEVTDKGIGIAEKDLANVFQKFFRARDKNVIAREWSGLGLFIIEHAVKAHNGKIKIKSTPGKGTTVSIFFPNSGKKEEK